MAKRNFSSSRVLCKFFAHDACLKGEHCEYSHDWKAPPKNICTYYQKRTCAYGSRCKYNHIKSPCLQPSPFSSYGDLSSTEEPLSSTTTEHTLQNGPFYPSSVNDECSVYRPMDRCPVCRRWCLHTDRPWEREEHARACEGKRRRAEAVRRSRVVECNVCMEVVLSKPMAAERRFGILSECDHSFCITCIRSWRSSTQASGTDASSTSRSCPVCRRLSYFVVPSAIWYSSMEEKQEIVNSYKARLRSIDCKHFYFGDGCCPFGACCFYKHAYRDGSLEEVVLAHLGSDDEDTIIAKELRLTESFNDMRL
ncbi:E3 ubiquitin-protein ligase makorin [Striga hermonthica]|uniref:E3 ubiquitin-protein ligase makorin n=1 Tax=Striga hermonthica TaxID=68872 RepID=A0A9N7REL4_STRHE|nr:E3 ubiquitin-protein ligase makorin [Striga hermonthica]